MKDGKFTRGKFAGHHVDVVVRTNPGYIVFAWGSGPEHFGITREQYDLARDIQAGRGKIAHEAFTAAAKGLSITAASASAAVASLGAAVKEGMRKALELEQARLKEVPSHSNCRSVPAHWPTTGDLVKFNGVMYKAAQVLHDKVVLEPVKKITLGVSELCEPPADEEDVSFLQERPSGLPDWSVGSFLDGV